MQKNNEARENGKFEGIWGHAMAEALVIHHLTPPSTNAWYRIWQLQPWLGKFFYDLHSVYLDSKLGVTPVYRAELCSDTNPNIFLRQLTTVFHKHHFVRKLTYKHFPFHDATILRPKISTKMWMKTDEGMQFLGAFISFVMSVNQHWTTWPPLGGFSWNFIMGTLLKSVKKIKV